jgi:radical SAM superfamily enzyme YgiQ (UPF0313 family)
MTSTKNILLINPWIHDFAAYDLWVSPLGLLYLASLLRKNGCSVRLVNCLNPRYRLTDKQSGVSTSKRSPYGHGKFPKERIAKPPPLENVPRFYHRYGITPQIFAEEIRSGPNPDVILVTSMMTYWYPGVFEAIRMASEIFPGVPIVLGGNYVTLCRDHAAEHSGADFVISGEGEQNLPSLLKNLLGKDFDFLPKWENFDSYPYPAFDLLSPLLHIPILTSKGCPFRCTYCASPLLSPVFRRRDPILVADEIAFWHKHTGICDFSIYDDAFLYKPDEMAVPLLKEVLKRGLPCRFHCPNGLHLREVTEELARLLFQARFTTIRFGFETSDPKAQAATGGKATNEHIVNAVQWLRRAGYQEHDIGIYILCGLPGQTANEVRETIRFVRSCKAMPHVAEFSPIPGTALWKDALNVSRYDIGREPLYQNNTLLPCLGEDLTLEDYRSLKQSAKNDLKSL